MDKTTRLDHRDEFRIGPALGRLIKAERQRAGLSLTELAEKAKVSRTYLSRLERGGYENPSLRLTVQLAQRLDISTEDLSVLTGIRTAGSLPGFGAYIRIKYPGWPERAIFMITEFHDFLVTKYSTK